jgi:hypothetical protein
MSNVIVQVFNGQKKMFAFPIPFRHFIVVDHEHAASLIGYKELCQMVASHANHNLIRKTNKFFILALVINLLMASTRNFIEENNNYLERISLL